MKPLPPLGRLLDLFEYNPATGALTWRKRMASTVPAGSPAGTLHDDGYLRVMVDRKTWAVHRIVWKMYHGVDPAGIIDHKNGVKSENWIDNLRDTTQSKNLYNAAIRSDNTTGIKGVVAHAASGKYTVNLKVRGRKIYLGLFDSLNEAKSAAIVAREKHHGEFACHGRNGGDR